MPTATSRAADSPAAAVPCTHAIPALTYAGAPAAIRWLVETLGADARTVHPGPDGTIAHAELWFGDGCVMLGSRTPGNPLPDGTGRTSVYLVLASRDAVDALHGRATAAGARIAIALRDTDYGSRDFACLDPEGNAWCFGTYAPAARPD